jgi:hypothetical protein
MKKLIFRNGQQDIDWMLSPNHSQSVSKFVAGKKWKMGKNGQN